MDQMSQNTSHAVMAQRVEPQDSLDDFPTPPWATRALIESVLHRQMDIDVSGLRCWEPACNRGYMARPLAEYFGGVYCTDVHDYGFGQGVVDYLFKTYPDPMAGAFDWVITNPPFRLAQQFIERSCDVATARFAMIARISFLESIGRYEELFKTNPPSMIA